MIGVLSFNVRALKPDVYVNAQQRSVNFFINLCTLVSLQLVMFVAVPLEWKTQMEDGINIKRLSERTIKVILESVYFMFWNNVSSFT